MFHRPAQSTVLFRSIVAEGAVRSFDKPLSPIGYSSRAEMYPSHKMNVEITSFYPKVIALRLRNQCIIATYPFINFAETLFFGEKITRSQLVFRTSEANVHHQSSLI